MHGRSPTRDDLRRGPSHPLCLAAIAGLLLNDLVLKELHPGFLTGKLSDVAWLVIAPTVCASVLVLTRLDVRRVPGIALATTAATYTTLQLWPPLGDTVRLLLGGSPHVADVGDLIVLPALFLARLCWRRARYRTWALPVAAAACLTSQVWLPPPHVPCGGEQNWDPNRPLTTDQVAGWPMDHPEHAPGADEWTTVTGPDGETVPIAWIYDYDQETITICPLGGLDPETTYVWEVRDIPAPSANTIPMPHVEPLRATFTTAPCSQFDPVEQAEDCWASDHYNTSWCDTGPRWDNEELLQHCGFARDTGDTGW